MSKLYRQRQQRGSVIPCMCFIGGAILGSLVTIVFCISHKVADRIAAVKGSRPDGSRNKLWNRLKRTTAINHQVQESRLDGRGKALLHFQHQLEPTMPTADELKTLQKTLIAKSQGLPDPFLQKKVAVVRGEGSGWIIGSTALLAGSKLVLDKVDKVGCPVDGEWDICWVDGYVGGKLGMGSGNALSHLKPSQIVAPLPDAYNILGEKRNLLRALQRAAKHFNDESFLRVMPASYELPRQRIELVGAVKKENDEFKWIAKPSYGSTARGLYLFDKNSKVGIPDASRKGKDGSWIIQQYLNPLLLKGHKFDLRMHTFVRLNPLRIYVHNDAVVRLASVPYQTGTGSKLLDDKCMHITNQAYQTPKCPLYKKNVDLRQKAVQNSHLWNMGTLMEYLEKNYGTNTGALIEQMELLIVKSVLSSDKWRPSKYSNPTDNYFSFLGPDIALDKDSVPYLLEINAYPTTAVSSPLGVQLKMSMLSEMWRMLGVGGYDRQGRGYSENVKSRIDAFCQNRKCKTSSGEQKILYQFEDEKQYKGSWRLAYPTKEIVTKNMLWTNSEWLPGHHNKLLHDYILFDGNHH